MAETVGLLILESVGVAGLPGIAGLGTLGATTIGGVSLTAIVGAAAILGVSIGLSYAFKPDLPRPEDGSQPLKQASPPRVRGYGINRLAGWYMLFEAGGPPPARSFDVMAFHSGRIDSVAAIFLHDDPIQTSPPLTSGGHALVSATYADGRYGGNNIQIDIALGSASQVAVPTFVTDPFLGGVWTDAHQGNGVAYAALKCASPGNVPAFTKIYPHQLPVLSVVAICSPVWDPRDPAQLRNNEATWQPSFNPVIQLIDYLTRVDGGMGLDYDTAIAPNLAGWMVEADLCDQSVETATPGVFEPRYNSHGWFRFDNKPEDVIGGILSTCDGWLAESGDGTLSITVGIYRPPADPPLTEKHIFGFALNYGQADEQLINQLDISFVDPASKYVQVQTEPWQDENSIALTGAVRAQPLDLKWVQSNSQARRLGARAMQRLNPSMTGSFTTSLYGLRYLGKRWVPLKYPFVSGLQDCVVEISDSPEIDLMAGRITWQFIRVDAGIEAYNPATDEGSPPVVPPPIAGQVLMREDNSFYVREDGSSYVRESA